VTRIVAYGAAPAADKAIAWAVITLVAIAAVIGLARYLAGQARKW
jgi:hypothetical protein